MPPDFTPKFQMVAQYISQRKFEQARQILLKVLQQAPGHPDASNGMALVLENLGQLDQALYHAQRAVAARPNDAVHMNTLASLLTRLNRYDEAIPILRRAIEAEPGMEMFRDNLANALWNSGQCSQAVRELRAIVATKPGNPSAVERLATKLTVLAKAPEAVALCREALPFAPHDTALTRALATSLLNDPGASVADLVEGHRLAGGAVLHSVGGRTNAHDAFPNSREPDRPLRVGFVSPDFRQHSVSFFVESLLERLDRKAFQILCYSSADGGDAVTARLKRLATDFVNITAMNDATAAARVVQDRVDILIDLAGHTVGTRLGIFAFRAAPVQIAYCGYPSTTGLTSIDYRLVDSTTDPVGSEPHCTESLLRLDPCFLCYRPHAEAPAPAPSPSTSAGHVTFGSFNATFKLNDPLIALWSRVLQSVPGSRLLLKAYSLSDAEFRADLLTRFQANNIEPGCVECLPATKTLPEHLATYARVDIALDPFPYHGTTTTCEAAFMGVPTITLEGHIHHSRVGVSLLRTLALDDLVATTHDEYIAKAAALAANPHRLATLRASLRTTLLSSPLGDADAFAKRFAAALRSMWTSFCQRR